MIEKIMNSNKSSKLSSAREISQEKDKLMKEMQNTNIRNILSLKIKDRLNVTQIQLLKNKNNKQMEESSPL